MSEVFREALRRYISDKPAVDREKWRELLEYGRTKGRELGVATEADVQQTSMILPFQRRASSRL
jgi:hypothetical protein